MAPTSSCSTIAAAAKHLSQNSDIGGHHIGFLVDDIDAAVAYLKSKGVKGRRADQDDAGSDRRETWVYFMAPGALSSS